MRDLALRRLVDRAIEAQHMHIFAAEDVAALKALAKWYQAVVVIKGGARWAFPLAAAVVMMLASWDKVTDAARAVVGIFRG